MTNSARSSQLVQRVVESVKEFVFAAVTPLKTRQESTDQLIADLERRIEALERGGSGK